ncbi:MAG: NCS2 family permease [Candidatus Sericytochromatia bacterium]
MPPSDAPSTPLVHLLDRHFRISERGTSVRTELLAGLTTFVTMSYIILVNPAILADAGIPREAAIAATIAASALTTMIFGLWANMPIAAAPGMGLNAFFTYSVVLGQGLSWQTALGAVFISGLIFLVLTLTGIRQRMIAGVPPVLQSAITVGIGLFIAFIGLKNAGVIIQNDQTLVTLGHITTPGPLLALSGVVLTAVLMARGVRGALLIGIAATTAGAMAIGLAPVPQAFGDVVATRLPSIEATFLQLDVAAALGYGLLSIVFSFTIVEIFDNLATLIGLARKARMIDDEGRIRHLDRALTADAVGTMASATMGSTVMTAYIENATGIAEGGRTGLTAVAVGALFLLALVFTPLIAMVPSMATAPVLVIVGALMLSEIQHVAFDDMTEAVPAFLTMLLMPLTFSIAEGLAFGFIAYAALKLLTGRWRELHWMTGAIALAFVLHLAVRG